MNDWYSIHERLVDIAKRKTAVEGEEAEWIPQAEDARVHQRLGYESVASSKPR